ncbi:HAD family phosphatase [Streptomyces sp. RB110-1]|uniref:HAD family phosphatase n=1 Tax=unclassified Streptomyces TaxID=2593676 RepID=UPI001900ECE0|nr:MULTISPECIES: HAD family phosphatase [unclassified Streptomyces]MBK0376040.1 HAD family phosphatase [Streptomyces sp. RB110-1]MBK0387586.1 HAD family phosphatase [Streptomyces sp. RB110-2]
MLTLRLAALNIDGVLLNDTFSPVIHHFITTRGGTYSAELERSIFSQPQHIAGRLLAAATGGSMSGEEALAAYFEDRAAHLDRHPVTVTPGTEELLVRLRAAGLRTICYGGLGKDHFDRHLGRYAELFDGPGYVCTNDFRPGLKEITRDVFGLRPEQALFVDDVAKVADVARELGAGFVGRPSTFVHSHQRALMEESGVRHLIGGLDEIDDGLVRRIDRDLASGTFWDAAPVAAGTAA